MLLPSHAPQTCSRCTQLTGTDTLGHRHTLLCALIHTGQVSACSQSRSARACHTHRRRPVLSPTQSPSTPCPALQRRPVQSHCPGHARGSGLTTSLAFPGAWDLPRILCSCHLRCSPGTDSVASAGMGVVTCLSSRGLDFAGWDHTRGLVHRGQCSTRCSPPALAGVGYQFGLVPGGLWGCAVTGPSCPGAAVQGEHGL